MSASAFTLDPKASTLRIRTRAKGLMARLAHDLEIAGGDLRGRVDAGESAWSGELVVPVAKLGVAGALHGDRLDPSGLSPSDRADVERRIRDEVLGGAPEITVSLEGPTREAGTASLAIGAGPRASVPVALRSRVVEGGALEVNGAANLSLRALGVAEIRGPLGAFKVGDTVEILVELTFRATP